MELDYDLSDLETFQANLWLFLRADDICAQILADQAERRASTRSRQPAVLAAMALRPPPRPLAPAVMQFAWEN